MESEQTFRVKADAGTAGGRVDRFLADSIPTLSRSRIKALMEAGHVRALGNDADVTIEDPSLTVKPGQHFEVDVPEAENAVPEAQAIPLDVVYEDDALIVIDKPAGLVVHPAPGHRDRTLVNALLAHCGESLAGIGGVRRPGIVHRLDKDTSGLIVAAKTDAAYKGLQKQFAARDMERAYKAFVWGLPAPLEGRIEGNIGRSARNRKKMAVLVDRGRPAVTRYRVLRRVGSLASLVECRLETGRTHQIRVHLASIGHAVIGDALYGGARGTRRKMPAVATETLRALERHALHAYLIGFRHPSSGETMRFESDLPHELNHLSEILDSF